MVIVGLSQIPAMASKSSLLLIIGLAVFANIFATSASISEEAIAFEVGTAVSMALIPLFSPESAAISAAACSIGIWLVFPSKIDASKRNWEQLFFNAGMLSLSIYVAGVVFINLHQTLGTNTIVGQIVPWIVAAMLYDQINFWMLMIIIRLKEGSAIKPVAIWIEHLWAAPINIIILSVGGGALAFATTQLGLLGIVVFFMPIVLSAYAFRLYVSQMQAHMNNLENIVAERTEALQKLMQEKDAFLAVLTHDMKSPLTSIHLYASMLKEYPQIVAQKPHLIDAVLQNQEALINIVNNILDLEKLKVDGRIPLEKVDFEYTAMAEKIVESLQVQAENKSIELVLNEFDRRISVLADPHQMERILNNLISNAVKYTHANGKVAVTLDTKDDQLILQVEDSGYGIPAEELPFVFDRFHRVESHQKLAAGTGLGLAITKALVEAHGGTIEVKSVEGEGSCFVAHLPILPLPQLSGASPKSFDDLGGRQRKHRVVNVV